MGTYTPESLNIKAPATGFQEGGWYNGRQYWGGTLSDAGQIHPQSNQQGAGQAVSAEVNAQSAAQQGVSAPSFTDYINKQNASKPATAKPVSTPNTTPSTAGMSGGTGTGTIDLTGSATPSLNLPLLYNDLYSKSGITDLEKQLAEQERVYTETKGKINDNPYLSEATRVGRVAKLEQLHNERTANARAEVATKKADIETQLNLATKQFDINSQQAQQALTQFNTLLSLGALDNATGDTIAQITRSTGISSDMIYSAIQANKAKNTKTEMIKSEDNNGNVTVSVVDPKTGEVIKQTSLGKVGTVSKTTGGTTSTTKNTQSDFLTNAKSIQPQQTDQGAVGIFPQLVAQYAPFMTLQQIYALYLQSEPGKKYGTPVESAKDIQELYNYYRGK